MTGAVSTRVAVLGAGHTGPIVARLAAAAGYDVTVSTSQDPERSRLIVEFLAPGARAEWADRAIVEADLLVLLIPLHRWHELDPDALAGKVVIDAMNYWRPVNGTLAEFEATELTSSEVVADRLDRSRVVKTLNHIGYHELDANHRPQGSPDRQALGVAGDDAAARELVATFVDRIGFDAVELDSLARGRVLEPGGRVFGVRLSAEELRAELSTETTGLDQVGAVSS